MVRTLTSSLSLLAAAALVACAAPPAYALPNPDPDVSLSWKPAPWAIIGPQAHAKATISARPQAAMVVQPYAYLMNAGGPEQADRPGTWRPIRDAMTIHPTYSELAAWALIYPLPPKV